MNEPQPMNTSLFHIQYQLEQRRVPFTRKAVLQLPKGRCGLYALWLTNDLGGYERLYAGVSKSVSAAACSNTSPMNRIQNSESNSGRSES